MKKDASLDEDERFIGIIRILIVTQGKRKYNENVEKAEYESCQGLLEVKRTVSLNYTLNEKFLNL